MESLIKEEIEIFKSLPILVYILRPSNKEVIYCNDVTKLDLNNKNSNTFFDDIFEFNDELIDILNSEWDDQKKVTSIFVKAKNDRKFLLFIKSYKCSAKFNETLLLVTGLDVNGIKIQDYFRFYNPKHKVYDISTKEAGIDFLEGCISAVKSEDTYFSLAYLSACNIEQMLIDDANLQKEEHIKQLVSIIKNSIRATDMFATITDTEFMMVFPKCKYDIMCNILTSIQNKLEFINDTNERKHRFEIDYAVLEVTSKNITSSDKLIKKVRDLIM